MFNPSYEAFFVDAHGAGATAREKERVVVFETDTASSETIKLKFIFCLNDLLARAHAIVLF